MRKLQILIIIGTLLSGNFMFAQKQRATIIFKNGDTIKGLAKIAMNGKIKYRENKKSETKTFDLRKVTKLKINNKGVTENYDCKFLVNKKSEVKPILLITVSKGKIDLYKINLSGTNPSFGFFGNNNSIHEFGGSSYSINNFYLGKKGSDFVEKFHSFDVMLDNNLIGLIFSNPEKRFRKAATEYFKDCSKLVDLIKNKTLKKDDIQEVIEFYNKKCE
jgi:hypothetical protein